MINPFKNIGSDTTDKIKKTYEKAISKQAWNITKLVISKKLTIKEIIILEKMYKNYFVKYPDIKAERNSMKRIAQLKMISK